MSADWTFHRGELDRDDVRALLDLHFAALRAQSPPEACHVLPVDGLRDPAITFVTCREDGRLLGCGALKRLDAGHGELKSMRTAPDALVRGVGAAVLAHLLDTARDQGMNRVSLETGSTADFLPALRLYERSGFERCGPFGTYRDGEFTRFYSRAL